MATRPDRFDQFLDERKVLKVLATSRWIIDSSQAEGVTFVAQVSINRSFSVLPAAVRWRR